MPMLHCFVYNTFIVKFNSLFFSKYLGATLTYGFLHKNFKILCALKNCPLKFWLELHLVWLSLPIQQYLRLRPFHVSRSCLMPSNMWWTGGPGVLRFMGSQRVGHDWATELNWTELNTVLWLSSVGLLVHKENFAANMNETLPCS